MISFKKFFNEQHKNKVNYSAIVLDEESRNMLLSSPEIKKYINSEHKIIAHHMTIKIGSLKNTPYDNDIGKKKYITATHVGTTDNSDVIAVRVNGFSLNKNPHVTISVNSSRGAKPKDSNYITNWEKLVKPIKLSGTVEEIYF
jgi:hypothetical protein